MNSVFILLYTIDVVTLLTYRYEMVMIQDNTMCWNFKNQGNENLVSYFMQYIFVRICSSPLRYIG